MNTKSVLSMDNLVFEEITFTRTSRSKSTHEFDCSLNVSLSRLEENELYNIILTLKGEKPEEYTLLISLSGIFSFDSQVKLEESYKNTLLEKNAVAILMPYLRSQLTLITAQPGMDCIILPPFNINALDSD